MSVEVQLVEVTKRFGEFTAVDRVSLGVNQGEFLSILGPSGCGKTTTLRMIAGLAETTGGQIMIRGQDVSNVPPYKRNIGMVFQDYALFPHMTVLDNVAFGLQMRRAPKKEAYARAQAMLELVRLPDVGHRRPSQLSGGQQQRVALARALAFRPTVLLLDEPLSNLDLKLRQELRVELRRIQDEVRITTIFVTHDQGEALSLSDRVVVMRSGRIEQDGSPVGLYEHPRTKFVASFLGDANFFRGRVSGGRMHAAGIELAGSELAAGEGLEITVALRPEKIHVGLEPGSGPNTATGTVDALTYLGSVTRYYVKLPGGTDIIVDSAQTRGNPYPRGAQVSLAWSPEDCIAIKEDSSSA